MNKHATYLPATHAETCGSLLTCSFSMYPQNNQKSISLPPKYNQNPVYFLSDSQFFCCIRYPINLSKVSLRESTNLVKTACSTCLLGTDTLEFLFHDLDGYFLLLPVLDTLLPMFIHIQFFSFSGPIHQQLSEKGKLHCLKKINI